MLKVNEILMDRVRKVVFLGMTIFILFSHKSVLADDIQVTLARSQFGEYVEPFDRKIRVTHQPTPFYVILENVSGSAQQLYTQLEDEYLSISIEMTDEKGRRKRITRKEKPAAASGSIFIYLAPGEKKIFPMLIQKAEWDDVQVVKAGEKKQFRVRGVYQNNGDTIYSPYYDVTIDRSGFYLPDDSEGDRNKKPRKALIS